MNSNWGRCSDSGDTFADLPVRRVAAVLLAACLGLLTACRQEDAPPPIRPVRAVTVTRGPVQEPVTLTGQIRARNEVSLGFRIDGKMTERLVNVGDEVKVGQVIAKIDPQAQQNVLRSANADLASTQASLTQSQKNEQRQHTLLLGGATTSAQYEAAQEQLQVAQAQVESAQARLRSAQNQVDYAVLTSEAAGTVTSTGAEPGEVVRAGQPIVRLALQSGLDAVFDVPAQLIREAPPDPVVEVWLADDSTVRTTGRVHEVSPQADPATRTYPVKVALVDPPALMRLGATVTGRMSLNAEQAFVLPGTALTREAGKPAVWVVDPQSQIVSLRTIGIQRYDADSVFIAQGLQNGDIVVTAGVHALRPGQKVRVLGPAS